MVRLRAFGKFSMRLKDAKVFVGTVLGQKSVYRVSELEEWLRDQIVQQLNDTLGENLKSILDLPKYYNEISTSLKAKVSTDFERYGVEITAFVLGAITPPEEVQKVLDQRTGLGVLGPAMGVYQQKAMADAMTDAAKNPSGAAGTGVGFGMGMMMPQMMANQMAAVQPPAQAATEPCPKCRAAVGKGSKFCPSCGGPMQALCSGCQTPVPAGGEVLPGMRQVAGGELSEMQRRAGARGEVLRRLRQRVVGARGRLTRRVNRSPGREGALLPPLLSLLRRLAAGLLRLARRPPRSGDPQPFARHDREHVAHADHPGQLLAVDHREVPEVPDVHLLAQRGERLVGRHGDQLPRHRLVHRRPARIGGPWRRPA